MTQTPQAVSLRILRLLMKNPYTRHRVQVYLEQLPDELPIELPLPEQVQIIASWQQEGSQSTILVQAPQPNLLILSWYTNRLRILGWQQQRFDETTLMDCPVFGANPSLYNGASMPSLKFCYRPQSLMLTVETRTISNNATEIKLKLYAGGHRSTSCQADWERNLNNTVPLPQLVSPPDTNIEFRRRTSSTVDWWSRCEIQTNLSGSALLAHYNTQLVQAGWTLQESEVQQQLLWSAWTLRDRHNQMWQICLNFVLDSRSSNHYIASMLGVNLDELLAQRQVNPEPINDRPESIDKELFWQLLYNNFPQPEKKSLWIEQLPPTLPIPLEFPENTQVLGSLVEEERRKTTLLLEVPLSPDQIGEDLIEQFTRLGWQKSDFRNVGFMPSQPHLINNLYDPTPTGRLECFIELYPLSPSRTEVKLRWLPWFNLNSEESADSIKPLFQPEELNQIPIPILTCPDQTEVAEIVGSIKEQSFSTTVFINTSLTATALINHYQAQMQQADWQQQATSLKENCHLSFWLFTDEQGQLWQGFLNLLARPKKTGQYTGCLRIKQPEQITRPRGKGDRKVRYSG